MATKVLCDHCDGVINRGAEFGFRFAAGSHVPRVKSKNQIKNEPVSFIHRREFCSWSCLDLWFKKFIEQWVPLGMGDVILEWPTNDIATISSVEIVDREEEPS